MKLLAIFATSILIIGCQSLPESVKDDGRAKAEQAKEKAEAAYRDLEKDMK